MTQTRFESWDAVPIGRVVRDTGGRGDYFLRLNHQAHLFRCSAALDRGWVAVPFTGEGPYALPDEPIAALSITC